MCFTKAASKMTHYKDYRLQNNSSVSLKTIFSQLRQIIKRWQNMATFTKKWKMLTTVKKNKEWVNCIWFLLASRYLYRRQKGRSILTSPLCASERHHGVVGFSFTSSLLISPLQAIAIALRSRHSYSRRGPLDMHHGTASIRSTC